MRAATSQSSRSADVFLRKAQAIGILERLCQDIEPTQTQFDKQKTAYESVGRWLSEGEHDLLKTSVISPQGSAALGTTVRPTVHVEFDVDLTCLTLAASSSSPAAVKALIGDRLKSHDVYKRMLIEKRRCWRLDYADEFHLDVTPSIPNPACTQGGELVPDKPLKTWKPTNPKGYRAKFEARANLKPTLRIEKQFDLREARAQVETLPQPTRLRGALRRIVQLCKHHRNVRFADHVDIAPLSIIITTLAAQSYEYCVRSQEYDSEFDLLVDVVRRLPDFIQTTKASGQEQWFVWNETTAGENFAEKWNQNSELAKAFFAWQGAAVRDMAALANLAGLDLVTKHLSESFGKAGGNVAKKLTEEVSASRTTGLLSITPAAGLAIGSGVRVRPNTFFGRE